MKQLHLHGCAPARQVRCECDVASEPGCVLPSGRGARLSAAWIRFGAPRAPRDRGDRAEQKQMQYKSDNMTMMATGHSSPENELQIEYVYSNEMSF